MTFLSLQFSPESQVKCKIKYYISGLFQEQQQKKKKKNVVFFLGFFIFLISRHEFSPHMFYSRALKQLYK